MVLFSKNIKDLKVVYSKEAPIKPIGVSDEILNKSKRIPGSISFVPSTAGLLIASEVVKDYVLENGNHLTNQKISALFKQLVESNRIVKVTDKKKSYFSVNAD